MSRHEASGATSRRPVSTEEQTRPAFEVQFPSFGSTLKPHRWVSADARKFLLPFHPMAEPCRVCEAEI